MTTKSNFVVMALFHQILMCFCSRSGAWIVLIGPLLVDFWVVEASSGSVREQEGDLARFCECKLVQLKPRLGSQPNARHERERHLHVLLKIVRGASMSLARLVGWPLFEVRMPSSHDSA